MMHLQPHKKQCGRDREGEKSMGGVEEGRQSNKQKEVLGKEIMDGWKNTERGKGRYLMSRCLWVRFGLDMLCTYLSIVSKLSYTEAQSDFPLQQWTQNLFYQ